jgi:hypothetical protein
MTTPNPIFPQKTPAETSRSGSATVPPTGSRLYRRLLTGRPPIFPIPQQTIRQEKNAKCEEPRQIPDCREFETHPTFPPAREFAHQNSDFPPIRVHRVSIRGSKKVFLEKRSQTLPVFIGFLKKTKPNRTQIEPKNRNSRPISSGQSSSTDNRLDIDIWNFS